MAFDEPYAFLPAAEYWIAAVDLDSYNITPKQIRSDQVAEALKEGFFVHSSQREAQKECDYQNSL